MRFFFLTVGVLFFSSLGWGGDALQRMQDAYVGPAGSKLAVTKYQDRVVYVSAGEGSIRTAGGSDAVAVAKGFLQVHAESLGVAVPGTDWRPVRITKSRGYSYVRLRQEVGGIAVYGAEVVVQLDKRGWVKAVLSDVWTQAGAYVGRKLAGVPRIGEGEAGEAALQHVGGVYGVRGLSVEGSPELVYWVPEVVGLPGSPCLAYVMVVGATTGEAVRERVVVDAESGRVVFSYSLIQEAKNREIYDAENTSADPGILKRSEGQGPTGIADVDLAYTYFGDTYDFYFLEHGRDSIDNAGYTLSATVRYCPAGDACPYENAYWDGVRMYFGEGYASADDVIAHELTHGVTQYESNLEYVAQSGAINESFSDIWGEFVDLVNGSGNDTPAVRWLMGEDLPIGAIRSMSNPPDFGNPDSTCSPYWWTSSDDNYGVHTNSGVGNKLAYLLVDGGVFNGETVGGMGISLAADLFYEAQTNLLTSTANYVDLANALQQAAINLGWNASQQANVTAACRAVKITADTTCLSPALPPDNDTCATATPVVVDTTYTGTTAGATTDLTDACATDSKDVWFSFTPDITGIYTISLCGSNFDTTLSVFTDCSGAGLLACNDDSCGTRSQVTLNLTQGVTYLIRVAGYAGGYGNYSLIVTGDTGSVVCSGNLVLDGGFEAGSPSVAWQENSTNFGTPLCTVSNCGSGGGTGPHSGQWWAWFGGISNAVEEGYVQQNVVLPSGGTVTLSFWLEIPAAGSTGYLRVKVDGTTVFEVTEADAPSYTPYQPVTVDLSAYGDDAVHLLSFESRTEAGSGALNFFVDDICLTVSSGEGSPEGVPEGTLEGSTEGTVEGSTEGTLEGAPEGVVEGTPEGITEGEGQVEGTLEGSTEGTVEGSTEGTLEGTPEGVVEGTPEGVVEGTPEGVTEGEGQVEGTLEGSTEGTVEGSAEGTPEGTPEGVVEGTPEGVVEGTPEGITEGEGTPSSQHSADQDGDFRISLSELLRVIQFFNSGGYHCQTGTEDGYAPGLAGDQTCAPHSSDYNPQDWRISLSELLRVIQFFNSGGYHPCAEGEDGFCPGP